LRQIYGKIIFARACATTQQQGMRQACALHDLLPLQSLPRVHKLI
jgi:hypothetical protein